MAKCLRLVARDGRTWELPPFTLGQTLTLRRVLDDGGPVFDRCRILDLLAESLPPDALDAVSELRPEQLPALLNFLLDCPPAVVPPDREPVDPGFAAAVVMRQFGAYTLPMLKALPLAEFFGLYRLARAVQADEALQQTGPSVAAALSGNLAPLAERCRALRPGPVLPFPVMPDAEQLAAARRLAGTMRSATGPDQVQPLDFSRSAENRLTNWHGLL